jgi:isocitrate lyase
MHHAEGKNGMYWFAPIVADAEAGFGGNLNAFELMKSMIEAGAAAVHFEDQLASAKKCGHMGGKVLVPAQEFVQKLVAARLAADIQGVPTILIARTDANGAQLITSVLLFPVMNISNPWQLSDGMTGFLLTGRLGVLYKGGGLAPLL